jgi:hypothetical protein
MPFKMMNPLKKMDTTAMKTVQKSAMKLKDLNNDGETTKADLLIKKGVYNKDGSPATLSSPAKEKENRAKKQRAFITQALDSAGDAARNLVNRKPLDSEGSGFSEKEYQDKKNNETGETKVKKKQTVTVEEGTEANKLMNKIMKDSQAKKAASSSGKKTTYSQAWEKMTPAAQKKYKSKAEFIKAAKAYNVKIGKTKEEKKAVISVPEKKGIEVANKEAELNQTRAAAEKAEAGFQKEQAAKKKAAAEKKAAEEAKKNKKLTPKEKRKAERNIKAQEKANKKIRKGGGTEIKVDKKNTTATAADRRKLKQGAKRLEQKLSLAQKEIDRKNKKKKEDKKGKDKKGKDNTSKTSKSFI